MRFSQDLGRFQLSGGKEIVTPEKKISGALQKLKLMGEGTLSQREADFEKPSNFFFLPGEYATILPLAPRNGSQDDQRLLPGGNSLGQGCVRGVMRQIFLAGEEAQEGAALERDVVADGAAQYGIAGLEGVEHRTQRRRRRHLERHLVLHPGQRAQVRRQQDADHGSVCTSTESTAGRSRTMADQLSPASAEAYTWPPVVPKYTPQASSESTAMASRSTLT